MAADVDVCRYPFGEVDRLRMHPKYAELRRTPGLAKVELPFGRQAWLATRYDDVHAILTDPRFSRQLATENDEPRTYPVAPDMGHARHGSA